MQRRSNCGDGVGVSTERLFSKFMNKAHDDIAAICSHAGIDPLQYRSFASDFEVPRPDVPDLNEDAQVALEGVMALRGGPPRRPAAESMPRLDRTDPGWRALRSVFQAGSGSDHHASELSERTLPVGSLSVFGACGGVGVTTILATMGRILSSRRERVLLVDGAPETMIPFYFGASEAVTGICSFQPPRGATEGPLLVISKGAEDTDDTRTWHSVRHSRRSVDRVLLDAWPAMVPSSREIVTSESVCLVVLTPDLHSAVRMRSLEQMFRSQEEASGRSVHSYYLLNKFERALTLHTDLRNWLAQQIGDRLLPFMIRRSDEVTQALAEGLTVPEYAPNSGITSDFKTLTDWLQAGGVESHRAVAAAGAL